MILRKAVVLWKAVVLRLVGIRRLILARKGEGVRSLHLRVLLRLGETQIRGCGMAIRVWRIIDVGGYLDVGKVR